MQEAQAHGQLEAGQALLQPAHTAYLDQRDMLERDAEIVQPDDWGWHAARFAVLPDGDAHQVALLDVYHDALTGDLGGSYLPLGEYASLADAELSSAMPSKRRLSMRLKTHPAGGNSLNNRSMIPQWQSMQS